MALSARAEDDVKILDGNAMYDAVKSLLANPYDSKSNPEGIINLGVAENLMCEDIITDRLNKAISVQVEPWQLYYGSFRGELSFRDVLAKFLTKYYKSADPIDANDLMLTSGVGAALEHVAYACADPGDCILIPAPFYSVISLGIGYRAKVKWFPIPLSHEPETPDSKPFQISQTLIEETYKKALAQGERVKAVLLINPNNPTGTIFTRHSIENLIRFTQRHDLHLIVDEIFGLTVHDEDAEFRSILSIPEALDSKRVHMVWGISKDFGLSGPRIGVICTRNQRMLMSLEYLGYFGATSSLTQGVMGRLLSDHEWLDSVYLPTNLSRLRICYKYVVAELIKRDILPHPAEATYFVWADITKYASTTEDEKKLFNRLIQGGVYIVPGFALHCPEPGWARFTVTTHMEYLQIAFQRMDKVLEIMK